MAFLQLNDFMVCKECLFYMWFILKNLRHLFTYNKLVSILALSFPNSISVEIFWMYSNHCLVVYSKLFFWLYQWGKMSLINTSFIFMIKPSIKSFLFPGLQKFTLLMKSVTTSWTSFTTLGCNLNQQPFAQVYGDCVTGILSYLTHFYASTGHWNTS